MAAKHDNNPVRIGPDAVLLSAQDRDVSVDVEVAVVGGGVVGLAIARSLAGRGHDVLLIEQHARLGAETSSRNSEVIHAGIYYPKGSLKARLCTAGRDQLLRYCAERQIPVLRSGKLIVATRTADDAALDRLAALGTANAVPGLVRLSAGEAKALEPELACTAALYSPATAVIDSHAYVLALEADLTAAGAAIARATRVTGLTLKNSGGYAITADTAGTSSRITARALVLAAGCHASTLAGHLASTMTAPVPRTRFAKGHYFNLSGRAPFSRLVYPLPDSTGLGIHFTRSTAGEARFGPDAVWCDPPSLTFDDDGGTRRDAFAAAIRTYWPNLDHDRLTPGTVGIRPKLSEPGAPAADFRIDGPEVHGLDGLVALYGIESPGLTASLAIADTVADRLRHAHRA